MHQILFPNRFPKHHTALSASPTVPCVPQAYETYEFLEWVFLIKAYTVRFVGNILSVLQQNIHISVLQKKKDYKYHKDVSLCVWGIRLLF